MAKRRRTVQHLWNRFMAAVLFVLGAALNPVPPSETQETRVSRAESTQLAAAYIGRQLSATLASKARGSGNDDGDKAVIAPTVFTFAGRDTSLARAIANQPIRRANRLARDGESRAPLQPEQSLTFCRVGHCPGADLLFTEGPINACFFPLQGGADRRRLPAWRCAEHSQPWHPGIFPAWLPRVNLGLDLQGGSYLLLEVNSGAIVKEKLVNTREQIVQILRESQCTRRYLSINAHSITVNFPNQSGAAAHDALKSIVAERIGRPRPLPIWVSQEDGDRMTLTLNDDAIKMLANDAVAQSIPIVRRRMDETGVNEPVVARQGKGASWSSCPAFPIPTGSNACSARPRS